MDDVTQYLAPAGPAVVLGGAIGWLLNWRRQSRKDAYTQITEATQKVIDTQNATIKNQSDRILHLEGRLDQLTLTMGQAFSDGAATKAELAVAMAKLDVANVVITRLEGEIADWKRRFPEEVV